MSLNAWFQSCGRKILDGHTQRVIGKIFSVYDNDNITSIRIMCDLPPIGTSIEHRLVAFVNRLLHI